MKFDIKIKNNGINNIPKLSKLIAKKDDSDLDMKDVLVNNGDEIKPNEIINVSIFAFLKDPNNIKTQENYLKFYLFNEDYGQIGNEGIIKICVLDESNNIIDDSKNIKKDDFSIFNEGISEKKSNNFQKKSSFKDLNQNNNENNDIFDTSN